MLTGLFIRGLELGLQCIRGLELGIQCIKGLELGPCSNEEISMHVFFFLLTIEDAYKMKLYIVIKQSFLRVKSVIAL